MATPYPDLSVYVPIQQRKRLGQHHIDLTPGTRVIARDGEIGRVEEIEVDPVTGELDAFWVRADGIFGHDMRIPAEWVERADESGVHVAATVGKDVIKPPGGIAGLGLVFSGLSPDGRLVEFIELPRETHPFFVATQAQAANR